MPRELKLMQPLIWDGKKIDTLVFEDPRLDLMEVIERARRDPDATNVGAMMVGISHLTGLPVAAIRSLSLADGHSAAELYDELTSDPRPFGSSPPGSS